MEPYWADLCSSSPDLAAVSELVAREALQSACLLVQEMCLTSWYFLKMHSGLNEALISTYDCLSDLDFGDLLSLAATRNTHLTVSSLVNHTLCNTGPFCFVCTAILGGAGEHWAQLVTEY